MTCLYLASASWRGPPPSPPPPPPPPPAPGPPGGTFVACRPPFRRHITRRPSGTGRAVGHFLAEHLQGQARIADHRVRRGIHLVDVQLVDVAVDDGLLRRIRNGVAEAARRQARAYREDEVAFVQVVCHLIAAHTDK